MLAALRGDPELADAIVFNELLWAPILMRSLRGEPDFTPRPFADADATHLQVRLQGQGMTSVSWDNVKRAIIARAEETKVHPIRDYLTALVWDGRPRAHRWLSTYLGVTPSTYADAIGRMFLISMVARVYEPGCKADYMLVLEGAQGTFKSTACGILAVRDEWFSDCLPPIGDGKDAQQHLKGKWLIEVAEMHATSRAEAAQLKAFLTRKTERYRPSFGHFEVHQPRQTVFVGTTNKASYLRDETGGRRFWPVSTGKIETEALQRDRDQLFAEAVKLYLDKVPWWPSREFEAEFIAPEQDDRFESDPWEETIRTYVAPKARVTVGEVARAVGISTERISTTDTRRVTACLEHLGWERGKRGSDGARYWVPKGRVS